jgi:cysteine desulfurase/selenocysteine lyase
MNDTTSHTALDVAALRADFPILSGEGPGSRLVYLDSASSSQKPAVVLETMTRYFETTHANVHRGVYSIAEEATRLFEQSRVKLGRLIGAAHPSREIVFTKNATEAINLVAHSWARANLEPGDAVLLTEMEHHANLVPWLMLAQERGIELRYLPLADDYTLDLSRLDELADGVKLVGITLMSNVLGTIPDLAPISPPPVPTAPWWWPTARSWCPTARSTCASSISTSWPSPATRCSARPVSGCSTPAKSCSRRCRRSSAAVR